MKKLIPISLAFCLFTLIACEKTEKINKIDQKIDQLEKKVSQYQDYDLQEKCSRKAKEFLKDNYSDGYVYGQNHFNKNMNRCFVYVNTKSMTHLYDANEHEPIGELWRDKNEGSCGAKYCKNLSEWDFFVKPYMEDSIEYYSEKTFK